MYPIFFFQNFRIVRTHIRVPRNIANKSGCFHYNPQIPGWNTQILTRWRRMVEDTDKKGAFHVEHAYNLHSTYLRTKLSTAHHIWIFVLLRLDDWQIPPFFFIGLFYKVFKGILICPEINNRICKINTKECLIIYKNLCYTIMRCISWEIKKEILRWI